MKRIFILLITSMTLYSCGSSSKLGKRIEGAERDAVYSKLGAPRDYVTLFVRRYNEGSFSDNLMKLYIDDVLVDEIETGNFTKYYLKPGSHKITYNYQNTDGGRNFDRNVKLNQTMLPNTVWSLSIGTDSFYESMEESPIADISAYNGISPYQVSRNPVINTSMATEEDRILWEQFANRMNVQAMDNFLYLYPHSPYAKMALERKNQLMASETKKLDDARKQNKLVPVLMYIELNPLAHNKKEALQLAVSRSKTPYDFQRIYKLAPDSAQYMPEQVRQEFELMNSGPDDMKIRDIKNLVNVDHLSPNIVSAKILSKGGVYKDFSVSEIKFLQSHGLPEQTIEAMITSTAKAQEEIKKAQKDEALMNQIKELIAQSQRTVTVEAVKQDNGNSPIECIKLKTALEACARTTKGFFKMACETTAKASFNCSLF